MAIIQFHVPIINSKKKEISSHTYAFNKVQLKYPTSDCSKFKIRLNKRERIRFIRKKESVRERDSSVQEREIIY